MRVNDLGSLQRRGMWQWQSEEEARGKAGVLRILEACSMWLSKSCEAQGQCLMLVGCRQQTLVLETAY